MFKWEPRKAPEVLLEAYFREFMKTGDKKKPDPVSLNLLTYIFMDSNGHSKERVMEEVLSIARDLKLINNKHGGAEHLPKVNVISEVVDTVDMPRIYAGADAFVLPSR